MWPQDGVDRLLRPVVGCLRLDVRIGAILEEVMVGRLDHELTSDASKFWGVVFGKLEQKLVIDLVDDAVADSGMHLSQGSHGPGENVGAVDWS